MTAVTFDILARDKASGPLSKVGKEMGGLHKGSLALGAGFGLVAEKALEMGKDVLGAFGNVASQTIKLQRVTGGSAEQVSRLRFALHETGIDADVAGKSLGIFERNLAKTHGNAKKTADLTKELGFRFKDAHGNILPMADLLPKVADRFKDMPNGVQKTALAMALFGRGGMAMLPFLNRGSEGIKELNAESDKLGNTLSGKDLAAVKANTIAKRQFNAALEGLSITLGRSLYPLLTKLTQFMTNTLLPAINRGTKFWHDHAAILKPVVFILGGAVGVFLAVHKAIKLWTTAQAALDVVLAANPIGLVVIAVAALAAGIVIAWRNSETFRRVTTEVFVAVAKAAITLGEFIYNGLTLSMRGVLEIAAHIPGPWQGAAKSAIRALDSVTKKMDAAKRSLDDLTRPRVVTVSLQLQGQKQAAANLHKIAPQTIGRPMAEGGFVTGGIPGVDSVPTMLMPGEFVVRSDRSNLGQISGGMSDVTIAKIGRAVGQHVGSVVASVVASRHAVDRANGRAIMTAN